MLFQSIGRNAGGTGACQTRTVPPSTTRVWASAEFLLHQEQIGFALYHGLRRPGQLEDCCPRLHTDVSRFCCSHVLPEVRPNHSRRHGILRVSEPTLGQGAARQGLDCSADARSNHPSLMWSLPGNSGGEHYRATFSNTLASVFNSGQRGPIAQFKGLVSPVGDLWLQGRANGAHRQP